MHEDPGGGVRVREDPGGGVPVVFSGGGTGGHLYPALALAEALQELRPDVRPVFLGARRGVEARVLPERGAEHLLVPIRGVARRGGVLGNLGVPWAVLRSLAATYRWFRSLRPELVVVTGGYASAPAGFVARLRGIPLVLQEQNAVPGLTTRLLARGAREIHVAYPEAVDRLPEGARSRAVVSGNPVRPPRTRGRDDARRTLGLNPALPTLLVVGGSQGSRALNRAVTEMVRGAATPGTGDPGAGTIAAPSFQLLWSTGPRHLDTVQTSLLELGGCPSWVHPVGYIHDMGAALEAADLALSRAGAMATSEFLAWGLPALLVPLPTAAAGHQARNAAALEDAGCALHLPEGSLTGELLLARVRELLAHPDRLSAMGGRARERGRPDAARQIARMLLQHLPPPSGASTPGVPA